MLKEEDLYLFLASRGQLVEVRNGPTTAKPFACSRISGVGVGRDNGAHVGEHVPDDGGQHPERRDDAGDDAHAGASAQDRAGQWGGHHRGGHDPGPPDDDDQRRRRVAGPPGHLPEGRQCPDQGHAGRDHQGRGQRAAADDVQSRVDSGARCWATCRWTLSVDKVPVWWAFAK